VLRVALTGGIACGKSVVSRILKDKGCIVFPADEAAHALMAPRRPVWKKIVARFGEAVLRPDKTIDRARLGAIVFADARERRFLNALIHPRVMAEVEKTVARLERRDQAPIFIVEAALTIEAGHAAFYDKVVVAHCPEDIQVSRLMARDKISESEARRKIATQMPVAEKLRHADYVVDASGSFQETIDQTERLYAELVRDAELKRLSAKRPARRTRRTGR
jgi:dephospho-CoA kinase